jgi:DNA polymerase-3 subunit alpha
MYTLLNNISHFTLLKSTIKPKELVKKAKSLGFSSIGIAEIDNITSCVEFFAECKDQEIKPILGVNLTKYGIIVIAKNRSGFNNIVKCVSSYLTIDNNNIVIVYKNLEENEKLLKEIKDVFYGLDFNTNTRDCFSDKPLVAIPSAYYLEDKDKEDQNLLVATGIKKTKSEIEKLIEEGSDFELKDHFIKHMRFNITEGYTSEELCRTLEIENLCENYSILDSPRLPKFEWTNGMSEIEYVRSLCVEGYKKKKNYQWDKNIYGERVKKELKVIEEFNLAGYFLIVQDYVKFAKDRNIFVNYGRGSVAGSLVAYLLDITDVDPIKHDLIFERFFNPARAKGGGLPDIDMDFPVDYREYVIDYIRNRYGHQRVAQMITLGRLQGSSALKEVLRYHEACDNFTANTMTKKLPKENEIDEYLKDMDHRSILMWVLESQPKLVSDYCKLEDGKLIGEYAQYFEQAIRIEGLYRNQGKHAAGLIISSDNLSEVCPMTKDKNGEMIASLEMNDLEKMGHVKFDILGVQALSRLMSVKKLLRGDIC